MRRPRYTRLLLIALLLCAALAVMDPSMAWAEQPFRLDIQIEDQVGALAGREAEVREALDDLQRTEQVQLWVAYVDTFSGLGAQQWADETAQQSDLGLNDVLLAVAVGDRAYAYSVDQDFPLSDAQLNDVMGSRVEPRLAQNDWAGAVVGAAQGMGQALRGEDVTQPGDSPGGGLGSFVPLLFLLLLGVGLAVFVLGRRRQAGEPETMRAPGREALPRDKYAAVPLDELRRRANAQLVETDDAVKTSEQELGFATAEFGEEQAAPFRGALDAAKAELRAAFALRKRLDDVDARDEPAQRQLLGEILRRTASANERLDAEAERFDKLRDLEANVPQLLEGLERQLTELEARRPRAAETLERLGRAYAPVALGAVADNAEEARARLVFAREQLVAANEDLAAGRRGEAVVAARAAEEAVGQARQLMDAIDHLEQGLAEAGARIDAAIDETARDVAEAKATGGTSLSALVARAEAAAAAAREAAAPEGGRDPLGALRRLEEAGDALGRALQQVHDAESRRRRAGESLHVTLLAARSEIDAATDYVTTHRGAIGSGPRMQLAEAERHFDAAVQLAEDDPVTASRHASQAHALAAQALAAARADVDEAVSLPQAAGMGPFGGGMGGLGGLGGAILGGILVGGMLGGGGMGGGRGGGFGGWRRPPRRLRRLSPRELRRRRHPYAPRRRRPLLTSQGTPHPRASTANGRDASTTGRTGMAQQSILGRIAQLTRANVNALLDSAEDPEKMLDQIIRDYTDNIAAAEDAIAQTIGNLRMMEEDEHENVETAGEWGRKAAAAASKADELRSTNQPEAERFENLARVALKRQIDYENQARDLRPSIQQQTQVVEKLKDGLDTMRGKLEELRTKRDELVSRAKMAEAQTQVHDALRSVDITDPTSEVSRFEEKIRREEARATGQAELAASSLDAQFESLDDVAVDAEVEERLAALRKGQAA